MIELKVEQDEMAVLSGETASTSPKYCKQLLQLANQDLEDIPGLASKLSEIQYKSDKGQKLDWGDWYVKEEVDNEENAVKRMMDMLTQLRESLEKIDEQTVKHFVHDQLITDTFLGHKVIEGILMKVAVCHNTFYEVAEDKDFDGYIGAKPVKIEPIKDHVDSISKSDNEIGHIYYQKDGSALRLFVDF